MLHVDKTFLILLIPLLIHAFIPFEDCGSELYLESIQISGCQRYPCQLQIGSTVRITTSLFIRGIGINSENLIHEVYFVVNNILTRVRVSPDPCAAFRSIHRRTSCALRTGERLTYETVVDVIGVPPLPATLYWTIKDMTTRRVLVCYKMTVILTRFIG